MKYPRKIAIGFQEGTCPLHCKKCFAFGENAKKQKNIAKMPYDRALWLISEIAQMEQIPSIQPHIFTEPFANDDLQKIIQACVDRNICMSIITNGILLHKEWLDFLIHKLDRRYTLSFSLDAVTQQTYEKVRGNYELKELEKKVRYLICNRGDCGPRVGVNFSVEEENYTETEDFLGKWKGKVDAIRINTAFDQGKKIPVRFRKKRDDRPGTCGYLEEVMVIDTDGQVRVCQFDAFGDTMLGNVFEEGIVNVWNGEKISEVRRRQSNDELNHNDFCYGCEITEMTKFRTCETENYIMKEADHSLYYNYKEVIG